MVTVNDCCIQCRRHFDISASRYAGPICQDCEAKGRRRSILQILHDAAVNTLKRPHGLRYPFTGTDKELKAAVAGTAAKLNPGAPRASAVLKAYKAWHLTYNEAAEALIDAGISHSGPAFLAGTKRNPRKAALTVKDGKLTGLPPISWDDPTVSAPAKALATWPTDQLCTACYNSGIELVSAGHGNVNEIPCSVCSPSGCQCQGSGYGGHPDSGDLCPYCNGSGDSSRPYPVRPMAMQPDLEGSQSIAHVKPSSPWYRETQ